MIANSEIHQHQDGTGESELKMDMHYTAILNAPMLLKTSSLLIINISDLSFSKIPTRWSAAESFLNDRFDPKSDIWMLSHAIREVFTYGAQPYTEMYSEQTDHIMAKVYV